MSAVRVGQRVRIVKDVDYYPYFTAKAGLTGTIQKIETLPHRPDAPYCTVLLDEPLEGCEHWGNVIYFNCGDLPADLAWYDFRLRVEAITD